MNAKIVSLDGKFGYINYKGDLSVPYIYDSMIEGKTSIIVGKGTGNCLKYGLIDKENNIIIPIYFKEIFFVTQDNDLVLIKGKIQNSNTIYNIDDIIKLRKHILKSIAIKVHFWILSL